MIMPRLYGRLGNQCFQIAAAIAHSRQMETSWAIPRVTNDMRIWPNCFLHTVPRQNITMYSTRSLYQEPRHCYDPLPTNHDLTIDGYFQSEKYFPTYDDKYAIGDALKMHCVKEGYIAIHVRRGDYIQFDTQFPVLSTTYYEDAVNYFLQQGYDRYRVYSDDIEWCKQHFTVRMGWNFEYSSTKDPLTDMRSMYNASGFIISNSTYSLFPALLRLDNPPVVAPAESRWYGPANAHLETIDLMPERFIKL